MTREKTGARQSLSVSKPSQEQLSSLLECYQSGLFNDAEKLAVSITEEFPKHQFGWEVLGAVLKRTGRSIDSVSYTHLTLPTKRIV